MNLMMGVVFWFAFYVVALLLPLGVALLVDPIDVVRPFLLEFGVAIGFVAYPLMTCEFALVGRMRGISQLFGNDVLMFFHKYMGIAALVLVVAHPVLIAPGNFAQFNPFAGPPMVRYGAWTLWLLVALAVTSLYRKEIKLAYGWWMLVHYVLALAIGAAGLAHILAVQGYSSHRVVHGLMIGYFVGFLVPMVRYRFWDYFRMTRRPWRVVENRDEGAAVRTLVLEPVGHAGFEFQPGQFAWLSTGHPVATEHHPISMASSAELGPERRVEFSIRDLGDWSGKRVPAVQPGSTMYLNGPFGGFSLDREPGQGVVLVGGGIGITPLRSMLRTMRDRGDVRPAILFYGARDWNAVVYTEELQQLSKEMNLKLVYVFEKPGEDWGGERGYITPELLKRHLPAQFRRYQYFMCGPTPMMDAVEEHLASIGVPRSRIHSERFDVV
ncbi:MAG: ferredoxin reductase family protein [Steroidobacteraceae bacterium]|jgi:predicted ferric reductase|nr:ferredoxin reductase family protein [Steroidobacteraceae bacterium]